MSKSFEPCAGSARPNGAAVPGPRAPAPCAPLLVAALCLLATAGHALAQGAEQQQPQPQQQPEQEGEDVYAGRTTKAYNPETAVFGPLPRWRSEDGNLNFGGGAMMQFDFGTYSQNGQGGPETSQALNPDLEPGIRARRGILLASGVSP